MVILHPSSSHEGIRISVIAYQGEPVSRQIAISNVSSESIINHRQLDELEVLSFHAVTNETVFNITRTYTVPLVCREKRLVFF